jgi:hypothetical protein
MEKGGLLLLVQCTPLFCNSCHCEIQSVCRQTPALPSHAIVGELIN